MAAGRRRAGPSQQAQHAKSLPGLEAQFGCLANAVYRGLLDLNTPLEEILAGWEQALVLRSSILAMYGVPPHQSPHAVHAAAASPRGVRGDIRPTSVVELLPSPLQLQDVDWKSKLCALVSKRENRRLTKGEIHYETVEEQDGGRGYVASCTSDLLSTLYENEEPASSKKAAEHSAAKVALQSEFPDDFASLQTAAAAPGAGCLPSAACGASKRRRTGEAQLAGEPLAAETPVPNSRDCSKSRLMHATQCLLGRTMQKGDVVFDTQALDEDRARPSKYVSSVSLPTYDPSRAFAGAPAVGKKQAENNAASVALASLHHIVFEAEEEQRQKKARQRLERDVHMQAKQASGSFSDSAASDFPLPS